MGEGGGGKEVAHWLQGKGKGKGNWQGKAPRTNRKGARMRFYLTAEWRQQTGQRKGPLGLPKGLGGGAVGTLASGVICQCHKQHYQ